MLKDSTVSARVETDIKQEAEDILQKLGIPVSVVINSLYRQEVAEAGNKNCGLSFLTDRSRYIAHPIILLFESNQSRFLFATNTSPELPCLRPAV